MAEIGIDISHVRPKPLTSQVGWTADVIVNIGCGDASPVSSGTRFLDWDLLGPVGQPLEAVRAMRDGIWRRVQILIDELAHAPADAKLQRAGPSVPWRPTSPADPRAE
ncbi:MAG: hypothetical protein ACYCVN_14695 [Acidimicrobiales bacterium]